MPTLSPLCRRPCGGPSRYPELEPLTTIEWFVPAFSPQPPALIGMPMLALNLTYDYSGLILALAGRPMLAP
jgi:hypothetical protein